MKQNLEDLQLVLADGALMQRVLWFYRLCSVGDNGRAIYWEYKEVTVVLESYNITGKEVTEKKVKESIQNLIRQRRLKRKYGTKIVVPFDEFLMAVIGEKTLDLLNSKMGG